mmetsp:Transcript_72244/g.159519  ORF Transcript_72244/g.159519 Transcript_72244/m.159519 type:complete len:238 (+) Transcript_72244:1297-2010(+)
MVLTLFMNCFRAPRMRTHSPSWRNRTKHVSTDRSKRCFLKRSFSHCTQARRHTQRVLIFLIRSSCLRSSFLSSVFGLAEVRLPFPKAAGDKLLTVLFDCSFFLPVGVGLSSLLRRLLLKLPRRLAASEPFQSLSLSESRSRDTSGELPALANPHARHKYSGHSLLILSSLLLILRAIRSSRCAFALAKRSSKVKPSSKELAENHLYSLRPAKLQLAIDSFMSTSRRRRSCSNSEAFW